MHLLSCWSRERERETPASNERPANVRVVLVVDVVLSLPHSPICGDSATVKPQFTLLNLYAFEATRSIEASLNLRARHTPNLQEKVQTGMCQ